MLEEPIPLPANFQGIITIYPDNHNTKEVRNYWLVPSVARIVRTPNGKLAFGLVHSGVSSFDPDGINALLNVTMQPYVDDATMQSAKTLVEAQAKADGATSVNFRYIAPTETTAQLLVGGQYYDWNGKEKSVVKGGLVEAGIPFQVKLSDKSFDVRALVQAGGDNASTFGVLYTMKFNGVRNRCDFDVTANFKETYEHFKAEVKASGWWGAVGGAAKTEWQTLVAKGIVKLNVRQCRQEDFDKFDVSKILASFMEQLTERTGFFAKELKPSGLPDAPGGGGKWGWGVSVGGGFERYDETKELAFAVDAQFTVEEEVALGMSFPSGGPELRKYVKNLSDTNKPFPTSSDFQAIAGQHKQCRKNNIAALDQMRASGQITQSQYEILVDKAMDRGCYVDYSLTKLRQLQGRPAGVNAAGSEIGNADILEYLTTK
ncbi:hypothetical protein [Sphingobium sp. BS19]|uniref:hypothetical protein n=1 Tax=Sphingobium sp. BS19 TaxID=3018973 RepID=UPI002493A137|nr:hypothetical protein [Sphingobium sp. BS19]